MKLAIMQPYIFPYVGYFQLISSADLFVLYDDVTYIKQGYINRNNILVNGEVKRFTIPVPGASSYKKIKDLEYSSNVSKVISTIEQAYCKSNYYDDVFPMIKDILTQEDRSIPSMCQAATTSIFDYLNEKVNIIRSSSLDYNRDAAAEEKLISMCNKLGGKCYINPVGGKALYDKNTFDKNGIELTFLQPNIHNYSQGNREFIPNLSIIDILMRVHKNEIKRMFREYKLVA